MTDYGQPPRGGWSPLVCELLVADIEASLAFWCDLIGFSVAYRRPEESFAYLERGGAQIMLHQRAGVWETAALEQPFGRGVMFQLSVDDLTALEEKLRSAEWPIYDGPRETWRRTGDIESGRREVFVQDPDGYLLMLAEHIGVRAPA